MVTGDSEADDFSRWRGGALLYYLYFVFFVILPGPGIVSPLNPGKPGPGRGQDIYHATHQFFLTKRSLYLFVWINTLPGTFFPNKDETRILTWSDDKTARLWDATGKSIGEIMKHDNEVLGAVFNKNETLILTWDGTARIWDADTGKAIGEVMQHYELVNGAIFNKDETHIYTWIGTYSDAKVQSWDIAIDPDFPMEYIKLQAQAITGTSYDPSTNTGNVLPPEEWRKIKEQYMEIAAQHYKNCRYPDGNVFRKLFPKEARKVRGDGGVVKDRIRT